MSGPVHSDDQEHEHERELVDRYTQRLVALARTRLPSSLRGRLDPEDVVQSVYRTFFRRLNEGQFRFDDSADLWKLLATIAYRKSKNAVKRHQREQRDARRDQGWDDETPIAEPAPGPEDQVIFYDSLRRLLIDLPENYKEVIVLRLESFSIAEIAARVERSQRTVLRVLGHVREQAARQLE